MNRHLEDETEEEELEEPLRMKMLSAHLDSHSFHMFCRPCRMPWRITTKILIRAEKRPATLEEPGIVACMALREASLFLCTSLSGEAEEEQEHADLLEIEPTQHLELVTLKGS